jgi:lysozyme family protein
MPSEAELLNGLSDDELLKAIIASESPQEMDVIEEILVTRKMAALEKAVEEFTGATAIFRDLTTKLTEAISRIGHAPQLEKLLATISELHQVVHHQNRLANTEDKTEEVTQSDEAREPLDAKSTPAQGEKIAIAAVPKTSKSTKFNDLEQEYLNFFESLEIEAKREAAVSQLAMQAHGSRSVYEGVGDRLGIPWWFIAAIHMMESGFNFRAHLHNGDPLTGVTKQVPAGRPKHRKPPPAFTWAESAEDALMLKKFNGLDDWSLARALYRLELYNGVGYRNRQLPTPYLWSFSNLYQKGKFVSDGEFDKNAVSKQCGAAVLIRSLRDKGLITLDGENQEEDRKVDFKEDIKLATVEPTPPVGGPTVNPDFAAWFAANISDVTHFRPSEFLVKGASHAQNGLNTDPPRELWPSVIPLARVLEALRKEIGKPIKLLSVYRSPAYNAAIDGAASSLHLAFKAADFAVVGDNAGTPRSWAKVVDRMRWHDGLFKGGRGLYKTFVHVDVRGTNNSWPPNVARDLS